MHRSVSMLVAVLFCLGLSFHPARSALAAGAVEMQVERIVNQMVDAYNEAMESGDAEVWLKYFADNVRRRDPIASQRGRKEFNAYYAWEFKEFKAKCEVKKMIVMGRSAAVMYTGEGTQRASETDVKVDMVAVFELGSSGRFEEAAFFYDTGKAGKLIAQAREAAK